MSVWSQLAEHWQHALAIAVSTATAIRGARNGWLRPTRWARSVRGWISTRANVEYDNQRLKLEIQEERDRRKLCEQRIAAHEQIQTVLRERIAYVESLLAGYEGQTPATWDRTTERRRLQMPFLPMRSSQTQESEPASTPSPAPTES